MAQESAGAVAGAGAIHGWGFTPTENLPPNVVSSEIQPKRRWLHTKLYNGCRRTALFCILLLLMLLVFLNLALTLWIISVLKLSASGMGPIKIVNGGIELDGQAWITDHLVASRISSRPAQPITLHAHRNFSVLVSEPDHVETTKLLIKKGNVEFSGHTFQINDHRGAGIFHASPDEVKVFSESLTVDGPGGVTVKSGLQVPHVRAPPGSDLQMESLTRRLELKAPQSIHVESIAGAIEITSHRDIKLDSVVGAIRIDAPNIVLSNLTEAKVSDKAYNASRSIKVYQLCACASGRLFLAAPDVLCEARHDDPELCR